MKETNLILQWTFFCWSLWVHEKSRTKSMQWVKYLITLHWNDINSFLKFSTTGTDYYQVFYWFIMKSQEQNQCKKKMLYHSLGIKMQINISSSFLLKLHENSEIINLKWELCITVLALKCHQRLLPVFLLKLHEKSRKNQKEKNTV